MSRVSSRVVLPDPPEGLQLSPIPNIRMASGAAEWITEHLGIPVSERYVRVKSNERLIRYSIISGVRHYMTFYKAVYRPAVLRANVLTPTAKLSQELKFHSLRHTYASLCVAAGIPPLEIARFMGHAKVTTTLTVYAHLFEDDHADAMDALGAMSKQHASNVIQLHG